MPEEKKNQLKVLIKDLIQLDSQSLNQMQFVAAVLLARDREIQFSKEKSGVLT